MPEKRGYLSKLVRSRDATLKAFIIQFLDLLFWKFRLREQIHGFQKR